MNSNGLSPKNLITLSLSNISSIDSEINLFQIDSDSDSNSATDTYFKTAFAFYPTAQLSILVNGVVTSHNEFGVSISALVNNLNVTFSGVFIFTYELVSGSGLGAIYNLFVEQLNPSYVLVYINTNQAYYFTEYTTILNSTVSVSVSSGLSYQEVANEMSIQPYRIDKLSVYASDLDQLDQRFKKTKLEPSGLLYTDFNFPVIDPMQQLFVLNNIEINFIPDSLSFLNYNLKGNSSVILQIEYSHVKIDSEMEKIESEPKQIETKEIITEMKHIIIRVENPLMGMVIENVAKAQKKAPNKLKEAISKKVDNREVSHQEVFTAFDGLDFTQY